MMKEIFLSFSSAILLILSFPNFNIWIVSWFGFVPLFFAIENKKPLLAFLFSYLTGIIFFLGTIYWLYHVSILGLVLLVLYLALYFGLFGLILSFINLSTYQPINLLFIPSVWVFLEYLRSHLFTGFGWVLLGYSQYLNLPIIQIADITGVWGISFLVMVVNVCIYKVIGERLWVIGKKNKNIILLSIFLLVLSLGYGYYCLNLKPKTYNLKPLRVSVIQANIPQEIKWEETLKDFILDRYLDLTLKAGEDFPDLIIWPEASYPQTLYLESKKELNKLVNFIEKIKIPILLGVVIKDKSLYFNSAILIEPEKKEIQRYDKLHLVPFGEYIPLKKIFGFLGTIYPIGDFTSGRDYTLFSLTPKNLNTLKPKFSVLICFEDIFPQISREFIKRGADFLVVITNDAWFGKTSAPYQHLQASVFRAIENRRYLVRSANTGISCFIAPSGKVISKVSNKRDIFICGHKSEDIFLNQNLSFYLRFGDYFVFLCFIISAYGIIRRKAL